MKFTALVAATTAAVASAQGATLAEKWALQEPLFKFDANTFNLTFPVTDYINTGMPKFTLWKAPDCQVDTAANPTASLDSSSMWAAPGPFLLESAQLAAAADFANPSATMLDSGAFNGREATIVAEFDPQTISQQTSDIYNETTVDNQLIAEVRFCVRFGLWTDTRLGITTPVEVNFLETPITLTVDLTDGFQIGTINVAPKNRLVRTANQAYEVRGFECTENSFAPLDEATRVLPRNQGQIIHVCVTPEDEAKADGIFMRSIDDFTFTKGGGINQLAIADGLAAGNLLTSYDAAACIGQSTCRFSTILFAQFYANVGTVDGAGVASMQFGNARRRLRAADRDLQGDGAGAAEFDLQFDTAQAEARTSNSGASSTSIAAATMSMVAIAAAML